MLHSGTNEMRITGMKVTGKEILRDRNFIQNTEWNNFTLVAQKILCDASSSEVSSSTHDFLLPLLLLLSVLFL